MAGRFDKVGGVIEKVDKRHGKVAAVIQPIKKRWDKAGGVWQRSFMNSVTVTSVIDTKDSGCTLIDNDHLYANFQGNNSSSWPQKVQITYILSEPILLPAGTAASATLGEGETIVAGASATVTFYDVNNISLGEINPTISNPAKTWVPGTDVNVKKITALLQGYNPTGSFSLYLNMYLYSSGVQRELLRSGEMEC